MHVHVCVSVHKHTHKHTHKHRQLYTHAHARTRTHTNYLQLWIELYVDFFRDMSTSDAAYDVTHHSISRRFISDSPALYDHLSAPCLWQEKGCWQKKCDFWWVAHSLVTNRAPTDSWGNLSDSGPVYWTKPCIQCFSMLEQDMKIYAHGHLATTRSVPW